MQEGGALAHRPHHRLRRPDGRPDDQVRVLAGAQGGHVLGRHGEGDAAFGEAIDQLVGGLVHLHHVDVVGELDVELEQAAAVGSDPGHVHLLPAEVRGTRHRTRPDGDRLPLRLALLPGGGAFDGARGPRRGGAGAALHDDGGGGVERVGEQHLLLGRGRRELRRHDVAVAAVERLEEQLAVARHDRLEPEPGVGGEAAEQLVLVAHGLAAVDEVARRVEGEEHVEDAVLGDLGEVALDRRRRRRGRGPGLEGLGHRRRRPLGRLAGLAAGQQDRRNERMRRAHEPSPCSPRTRSAA